MTVATAPTPFADAMAVLEAGYYTQAELAKWLQSPQPLLDGLTPLQALAMGRGRDVAAAVLQIDGGVFL